MTHEFTGSEFWNERYKNESYMYGVQVNDFLQAQAHLISHGGQVLSLAEGEGRNAVYLAQQGYHVHGVDFSLNGQEKALKLAKAHKVVIEYDLADLTAYKMGVASWDAVVSIFCHLHDTERLTVYKSVKQALKPGGVFILEAYNRKQLKYGTGGPRDASYLASLDQLKEFFEEFDLILAQDIVREIHEGEHHFGSSAVTQFIARKPTK
ncbi:class I SAM-dependent methyltransferase [Kordiimonas aquimaris]|uniref:class I SAM-dependent methyltransferase n=1 Tax=Kordiimonas aquimaris TaxID=707591 RepID=UPI0021CEEC23|nr:class I SAM-dependent methyltransferase [Kordiimonas aquimaris]